jgi:hypothetical protein
MEIRVRTSHCDLVPRSKKSRQGLFIAGGLFGYKMVYPASLDFLIGNGLRFQPMITIAEYTSTQAPHRRRLACASDRRRERRSGRV